MHGPYLEANKEHIIFYFDNKGKLSQRLFLLKNYMMPYIKQSFVIALDSGDINLNLNLNEHLATLLLIIPIQIMKMLHLLKKVHQRHLEWLSCIFVMDFMKKR